MKNIQKNTGVASCQPKSFIWKTLALVFTVAVLICLSLVFVAKPNRANAEGENVTITFDTNGSAVSPIELPADSDISSLAPTSEKAGFSFVGWTTEEGVDELYVFDKMPSESLTLYAKWDLELTINSAEGYVAQFDNSEHTISVDASSEAEGVELSYEWYYQNTDSGLIDGATESTFTVKNVVDSGYYICKVTATADEQSTSVYTELISVDITPYVIEIYWPEDNCTYNELNQIGAITPWYLDVEGKSHWLKITVDGGGTFMVYKAGGYLATASFIEENPNYALPENPTRRYYMKKAEYDLSNLKFEDKIFEYDGQPHSLVAENLPNGVTVTYSSNNSQVNYKPTPEVVTAYFTGSSNYKDIPNMQAQLIIKQGFYNPNYVWLQGKTVIENGEVFSLELGFREPLPPNYTVTIENNAQYQAGVHTVTAYLKSDGNYNDIGPIYGQLIINKPTVFSSLLENNKPVLIMERDEGFGFDLSTIINIKNPTKYTNTNLKLEKDQVVGAVYDIGLAKDGVGYNHYGWVNVRVLLPEVVNNRDFTLYHDHNGTISEVDYKVVDGYVEFRVLEFSDFIFVYSNVNLFWVLIGLGGALVLELIVILVLTISLKVGKGKKTGKGSSNKTVTAASASPLSLLVGVPFMPTGAVGIMIFLGICIVGCALILSALIVLKAQQNKKKKNAEKLALEGASDNQSTNQNVAENDTIEEGKTDNVGEKELNNENSESNGAVQSEEVSPVTETTEITE